MTITVTVTATITVTVTVTVTITITVTITVTVTITITVPRAEKHRLHPLVHSPPEGGPKRVKGDPTITILLSLLHY